MDRDVIVIIAQHQVVGVGSRIFRGGRHGDYHPLAWCQEFDGGRSFYTALGHFDEAFDDDVFMTQIYNGILWTARLIE